MNQRSKSDSNCLPHHSDPSVLYSSIPILGHFIHENQERGGSSPTLVQQQYVPAAHQTTPDYMQTLPGSVYFNQGKMRDVSVAMKQYIDEAEAKQNILQLQIDSLSAKITTTNAQLQKSEGELNQVRSQHARDRQDLLTQNNQKLKALEVSTFDKEEQLRNIKKVSEKYKSQNDALLLQKQEVKNFIQMQESSHKEEKLRLDNLIRSQDAKLNTLSSQLDVFKEKENQLKAIETKLSTDLILKSQDSRQKNEMISDLKEKVKFLKEELKTTQGEATSKTKMHGHTVEVSRVMQYELSKLKEKLAEQENEVKMLKEERYCLQQKLRDHEGNEGELKRAASNGQDMVMNMQEKIEELKDKNVHLLGVIKDYETREKELEKKVDELSQVHANASFNESFIESKIMKTESKLKKDVAKIKRNSSEVFQKHKMENEALKKEVRNLQIDSQRIAHEWENKEQKLLSFYNEKIKEMSVNYETERRNTQLLNTQLEKSYAIIADFEDKTQNLSRKSSESDNQLINLEVSNTELHVQIEHQAKSLEVLESEQKEKEKERKFVIAQLRKKNKELQQINGSLSNEIARLTDEKERCLNDLEVLKDRKSQIERQSKQLSSNLFDMNQFMQKTREEVEQLRTENQRQVEANQKLSAKIDLLKARYTDEHERHVEHKTDNEYFQTELRQKKEEYEYLCNENMALKRKLKEGVLTLEHIINENEKYQNKVNEQEDTIIAQKRKYYVKVLEADSIGKQFTDATAKLNEMQEDLSATKQTLIISQKDENDLRKEIRCLKNQIEDLDRQKSLLDGQYDGCLRDKQRLKQNVESLSQSLRQLQANIEDLSKEKSTMTEYVGKIECEIKNKYQTLQHQEEKIAELSRLKENLQTYAVETKEELVTLETRNKRLDKEIQEGNQEREEDEAKIRGLEKQLQAANDALEKFKVLNSNMKIKIEELKTQKSSFASNAVTKETTYKDLCKQFEKLKVENERLQSELSTAKAQAIEMQGVIDGAQQKQAWFTQHDQEQRTEVVKLHESNQEFQKKVSRMAEEEMRKKFQVEKLENELKLQTAEFTSIKIQMEALKENSDRQQEEFKTQLVIIEKNLKQTSIREQEAAKAFEAFQEEHKELSTRYDESKNKCDELTLENHQISDGLTKLEAENKHKSQLESTIKEKNEQLQENFVKLVDLLRKLKKERDSLTTMFDQSEEENKQLISRCKKLHADMLNTSSDLQKQKQHQNKTAEDNEKLKSRINILKYAESLRSSENKELMGRLEQLEAKLNEKQTNDNRRSNNDDHSYERKTSCDLFTDSIHNDTIIKLCQRLHTTPTAATQTMANVPSTAEKYKDELKSFMDQLFTKHSVEETPCQRKRYSTSRRSLRHKRYRRPLLHDSDGDDDDVEWNNRQMDRLYEDTKRIQASLLADIKHLSKNFAGKPFL